MRRPQELARRLLQRRCTSAQGEKRRFEVSCTKCLWGVALVCGLLACGGGDDETEGVTASTGGSGGTGGSESLSTIPVIIHAAAVGATSFDDMDPIADAELCTWDRPGLSCTSTDALGGADVQVLSSGDTGFTIEKADFLGVLLPFTAPIPGTFRAALFPDALLTPALTALGLTYPDTANGAVFILARESTSIPDKPVAGVTVTLSAATSQGPFYADENGMMDTTLTQTSESGQVSFWSVPPGEVTLSASHAIVDCEAIEGWPAETPGEMTVPVQANMATLVTFGCM